MKNLFRILFAMVLFSSLFMASCGKDDDDKDDDNKPEVVNKFSNLKTHLIASNLDLPEILNSWITTAENVYNTNTDSTPDNDFYIIDIRKDVDYNAGHIEGSVHSTLADIVTTAANCNGKPIIVVCYTGQGAGHGVVALRLSGYPNAKVMKWGMSGWNDQKDSWSGNIGSVAVGNANWEAAPGNLGTLVNYGDPTIESSSDDGATILEERVTAMLTGGFSSVSNTDVLANPNDYFINNFWDLTDVEHYGHIKGAVRVKPLTLTNDEYKNYNPSLPAVSYCWTGQTSSMVTAYMTVLGYNAKSLKFGCNGMIYDELQSHKWSAITTSYPLVTK